MRTTQQSLFDRLESPSAKREQKRRVTHGGAKARGKRKTKRPLATKQWMHLVLKANKAVDKYSMLAKRNASWIDRLIKAKAKKFGVELKDFVNMGDHLHLQIRITNREYFQNFLRSITTLIARHVTGARKGKKFGKFWADLAFTRIVTSFIELTQLAYYFTANRVELRSGNGARARYLDGGNEWIRKLRNGKG